MPNAILVNLSVTYPMLTAAAHDRENVVLRDITCCFWRVNREAAAGVRYVFGVFEGQVVSGYAVPVEAAHWPEVPAGVPGEGRLYVPGATLSAADWKKALAWTLDRQVFFGGGVRYAEVELAAAGELAELHFIERDDAQAAGRGA